VEELAQANLTKKERKQLTKEKYPIITSIVLWLKIGAVAFAILILALGVGLVLVKEGFDNQRVKDNKDLLERRIDSCERDNLAREGNRKQAQTSADSAQALVILLLGNRQVTPEIQAALDKHHKTVVEPFLVLADPVDGPFKERDCSPESVQNGG